MAKKLVIGIVVAVALLAVIGIAAAGSGSDSEKTKNYDGECTYKTEEVSYYTVTYSGYSHAYVPSSGMKFVRVTGTLENIDSNSSSFTNNPYHFKLVSNGVKYDYTHDNIQTVTLAKGGSATFDLCYEIPADASDYTLEWTVSYIDVKVTKQ